MISPIGFPGGFPGGMIRARDGTWTVKFWQKFDGLPPGVESDDFVFILQGRPDETAQAVFTRALPVAEAVMNAQQ